MYIESSYYHILAERAPHQARERYRQYYRDLHHRYGMKLDESTFLQGSQYNFNQLAYRIFDQLSAEGWLNKIDLMILSYWTHEFDPDYASIGLHVSHRYQLDCHMFDVSDQGSLCALTGLHLAMNYQSNASSQKTLCFSLDQNSIPRSDDFSFLLPIKNVAAAFVLSMHKPKKPSIKIIDIKLLSGAILLNKKFNITKIITQLLKKHSMNAGDCILCCRRNSVVDKAIYFYQNQFIKCLKNMEIFFLPVDVGCAEIFWFVNQLLTKKMLFSQRYILFISVDIESFNVSIVVLDVAGINKEFL